MSCNFSLKLNMGKRRHVFFSIQPVTREGKRINVRFCVDFDLHLARHEPGNPADIRKGRILSYFVLLLATKIKWFPLSLGFEI